MKNEKFYGTEPKGYCPFEQAAGALGWACWRWARSAGTQAAGVAAGAGAHWARSVRQALGVRGRALQARGRSAQRQAELAAGWASGSSAQGARQAGRAAATRRARGKLGERQQGVWGAQATGARAGMAWARRGARLGARCARGTAGLGVAWALDGWQTGPAWPVLVHCAPDSVLARFFDPVRLGIFPSHQMNTVHSKINFFFKKKIFIKF